MSSFISIPSFAQNVRIGKFRLIERLGRGGMGEVWKAEDTTLKRNVALKVIVPEFALRDDIRSRFLQEAQSAAQVEHERIVRIFEVGEDQRIPYIAMELLRGEDLATYLEREPIPPLAFTLKVVAQVLQGLSAAHTHPIKLIHRDIKPQNVWLEAVEEKTKIRCKILDFGIAKSTVSGRQQTQSGMVIGTLEYMSAEQLNAEELDARADLYSVGVMFYQMLTGQFPYQSPTAAMRGVEMLMTKPPTPQEWNSSVPKALSDFVMRMIAVKRQNRPSSAMESIELLGRGVGNLNEMGKVPTSESVLEHFEERTATAKPKPISQRAGSTGSLNRDPKPEKPPHPVRPIPPSRPSVRSRTKDKRWRRALEQFPTPTRRDSIGHPVAIFVGVAIAMSLFVAIFGGSKKSNSTLTKTLPEIVETQSIPQRKEKQSESRTVQGKSGGTGGGNDPIGNLRNNVTSDDTTTNKRSVRWNLIFQDYRLAEEYFEQISQLKCKIIYPLPPKWDTYIAISEFKPGSKGVETDLKQITEMYYICSEPGQVQILVESLGLKFAPPYYVLLLPQAVENHLAALEVAFKNRKPEEIESTSFKFVLREGKVIPIVWKQTYLKEELSAPRGTQKEKQ